MIDLPTSLRTHVGTKLYLSGFSTLPKIYWWGWELLDHPLEFSSLWMYDIDRQAATEQITSAFHFHYGIAGQAVLEFRKFRYTIAPGQAFLIAGPEQFAIAPHPDSPHGRWENLGMMISGGCQIEMAREIMERHGPIFLLHDAHPIIRELVQFIRGGAEEAYPDAVALSAACHPFLLTLSQEAVTAPMTSRIPVAAVIIYMRTHFARHLTLQQLADYASYSVPQLTRLFRAQTGLTPMEYLTRLRLTIAIETLMSQPDLTAARVAGACGFQHKITLYKVTQRYLQCTPSAARKMEWELFIRQIWPEPPFWVAAESAVRE